MKLICNEPLTLRELKLKIDILHHQAVCWSWTLSNILFFLSIKNELWFTSRYALFEKSCNLCLSRGGPLHIVHFLPWTTFADICLVLSCTFAWATFDSTTFVMSELMLPHPLIFKVEFCHLSQAVGDHWSWIFRGYSPPNAYPTCQLVVDKMNVLMILNGILYNNFSDKSILKIYALILL